MYLGLGEGLINWIIYCAYALSFFVGIVFLTVRCSTTVFPVISATCIKAHLRGGGHIAQTNHPSLAIFHSKATATPAPSPPRSSRLSLALSD